jgi:hypothetical protein
MHVGWRAPESIWTPLYGRVLPACGISSEW